MSATSNAIAAHKASAEFQDGLWAKWPTPAQWPGTLDLYEAAAYVRVSPATLRRACRPDRGGRASLAHQRFGTAYRLRKASLDAFGAVKERGIAA